MNELNNNMSYEEAFAALRETVEALENPRLGIEEGIGLYERACRLVIYCQRKLEGARVQVTDINERMKRIRKTKEDLF